MGPPPALGTLGVALPPQGPTHSQGHSSHTRLTLYSTLTPLRSLPVQLTRMLARQQQVPPYCSMVCYCFSHVSYLWCWHLLHLSLCYVTGLSPTPLSLARALPLLSKGMPRTAYMFQILKYLAKFPLLSLLLQLRYVPTSSVTL